MRRNAEMPKLKLKELMTLRGIHLMYIYEDISFVFMYIVHIVVYMSIGIGVSFLMRHSKVNCRLIDFE